MYNLKKIVTYITTLLISTTVIVVTIGSITGIEDIYNSIILTLLTIHFILSYLLNQLN